MEMKKACHALLAVCIVLLAHVSPSSAGLYKIQGLGNLGILPVSGGIAGSYAYGINDAGQVVGQSTSTSGWQAFKWDASIGMIGLGYLPGDIQNSRGSAINSSEVVVGSSSSSNGTEAFLWNGSVMTGLGDLPGGFFNSTASAINDSGQVVGTGYNTNHFEAFLYDSTKGMRGLGSIINTGANSSYNSYAYDINDLGLVTGYSGSPSGDQAVIWQTNGSITPLGDLPGGMFSSRGKAINPAGAVVGYGTSANGTEAFIRTPAGSMAGLGALSGLYFYSDAWDINDSGLIAGVSRNNNNFAESFTWDDAHGMLSLQYQLDSSGDDFTNIQALYVNYNGQLAGTANGLDGRPVAVLLTPVAGTDADGDGYFADNSNDCDDSNAAIHPYASEISLDSVDQDCNGVDRTINVTTATYSTKKGLLTVEATSNYGQGAGLSLKTSSTNFGSMTWNKQRKTWTYLIYPGYNPGTIYVYGAEGWVTKAVTTVR